jgi:DUF971 family protein
MAGLSDTPPIPTDIKLHQQSRLLELVYEDGSRYRLPFEFLRVHSPSAEVRGHGEGQEVLQTGKRQVELTALEPVGHYALKLVFSDGHDSGLYSWDYLHELCLKQEALWADYLQRLEEAGASRDLETPKPAAPHACGRH